MSDHSRYKTEPLAQKDNAYCTKCVYPIASAVALNFNEKGVCTGCQTAENKEEIDWAVRKNKFERLVDRYRVKDESNYDCVIPVSGGKDSYFQIHIIKNVMKMNPLLVTYHGNNYTKTGLENLRNMKEVFSVDHIFFTPNIRVLKVLNRMAMRMMGDMNWHAHAGIFTYPIQIATYTKVPLIIWGEHGRMDVGGMHSYRDFVEFTYRYRHEHACRGYEWIDFVERSKEYNEQLTRSDMLGWIYPTNEKIDEIGVRGIYISNYFKWDANDHGPMMKELYGFKESDEPFERTYRRMSNLDDMHENGIHDYMKFIKFGYGRATDHCCKDIRAGLMTRDEAIEIVSKRDPIKSKDLYRWLDYVGWTEEEFDKVADTFRDPRVWWIKNGRWWKHDLRGKPKEFGLVR
jgi:N-acetyl sugar amidotransferase